MQQHDENKENDFDRKECQKPQPIFIVEAHLLVP